MSVDEFLHGLKGAAEGGGEFTIDPERIRKSLSQFQVQRQSFFLLKLFQSAHGLGVDSIRVELGRSSLRVSMSGGTKFLSSASEAEALLRTLDSPKPEYRDWAIALNAAASLSPWSLRWETSGADSYGIAWSKGAWKAVAPSNGPIQCSHLFVLKFLPIWKGASFRSCIHDAILKRCAYAKAQIFLDNREIVGHWSVPTPATWLEGLSEPHHLIRGVETADGPLEIMAFGGKIEHRWSLFENPEYGRGEFSPFVLKIDPNPGERWTCRGAYALSVALEGPSRFRFVNKGVVLDTIESHSIPGLDVVADGSSLTTDVSGLAAVRNQELQVLIEHYCETVRKDLKFIRGELKTLPAHLRIRGSSIAADFLLGRLSEEKGFEELWYQRLQKRQEDCHRLHFEVEKRVSEILGEEQTPPEVSLPGPPRTTEAKKRVQQALKQWVFKDLKREGVNLSWSQKRYFQKRCMENPLEACEILESHQRGKTCLSLLVRLVLDISSPEALVNKFASSFDVEHLFGVCGRCNTRYRWALMKTGTVCWDCWDL